eukprot:COSAG05_NODE_2738_length_2706_cov_5.319141_2_plen_112_part_00
MRQVSAESVTVANNQSVAWCAGAAFRAIQADICSSSGQQAQQQLETAATTGTGFGTGTGTCADGWVRVAVSYNGSAPFGHNIAMCPPLLCVIISRLCASESHLVANLPMFH